MNFCPPPCPAPWSYRIVEPSPDHDGATSIGHPTSPQSVSRRWSEPSAATTSIVLVGLVDPVARTPAWENRIVAPSGDHAGWAIPSPQALAGQTERASPPSEGTTNNPPPAPPRTEATAEPSGDQAGPACPARSVGLWGRAS